MANFEPLFGYASFVEDYYVVSYSSFDFIHYFFFNSSKEFVASKVYIANYEGFTNERWYLNSGTAHHLTNNMINMYVREEFKGSNLTQVLTLCTNFFFIHQKNLLHLKFILLTMKDLLMKDVTLIVVLHII